MTQFTVDHDRCNKDGICVAECPMGIIELPAAALKPGIVEGDAKSCINCGHCVAVCPAGAISLSSMTVQECQTVEPEALPGAAQFSLLVKARRSIRVYKKKMVEREKLERIFETVRYAPTGKNTQLLRWLVISDKEMLENLTSLAIDWMRDQIANQAPMAAAYNLPRVVNAYENGFDPILRGAPCLIVASAPREHAGGLVDSTIALNTFELAACTEGLGSCWAGFFMIAASQWQPLQTALELPEGYVSTGAMMTGYPKYSYKRIPLRNEAKVTWR